MEIFKTENLSFTYPNKKNKAVESVNLSINRGEFVCLCGQSGCGKTTLLRLLKPSLMPHGEISGSVQFLGKDIASLDKREQAFRIGFVMQDVENQVVTDKVWHELAFGLESLGIKTDEIRKRVSEMASFFGIDNWFHKKVTDLSGGQKQLLNLASVMVMQPDVLILDEPTAQLDPIATNEFLKTLEKINEELGTTIILSEHRLEEALPISTRVLVMDDGKIIADDTPQNLGKILKEKSHPMFWALPTPMRVYGALTDGENYPITVKDGRLWLEDFANDNVPHIKDSFQDEESVDNIPCVEIKNVWFRYEKDLPDVLKGVSLTVNRGEIFSILGGNGNGKTTLLSLISAVNKAYRGEILINGEKIDKVKNLYTEILGVLPQNPKTLFTKKTVYEDLMDIVKNPETVDYYAKLCEIEDLYESHPYDLSGGEQQRTALCKVLLKNPQILLLDEPTKGFDAEFKEMFARILKDLKTSGKTIVMVSHDIEFCAYVSDRCSMLFDGIATVTAPPKEFFCGNNFYTTSANRMARAVLSDALLAEDIIEAFGGKYEKPQTKKTYISNKPQKKQPEKPEKKRTSAKLILGSFMLLAFAVMMMLQIQGYSYTDSTAFQIATIVILGCGISCFLWSGDKNIKKSEPKTKEKMTRRTVFSMIFVLVAVPVTTLLGNLYFGDRKYYFISILIILETLIPFLLMFEGKKPDSRKIVLISVLCALAVAGRVAFSYIPQFKPILALIIISGVCFGGETGFLVGTLSAFVSNFFFGQGPWTPWQMLVMGVVGALAGIIFANNIIKSTKLTLSVYGFFATLVIYGVIMNVASVLMMYGTLSVETVITACALGLPMDIVHSVSTGFFLWFVAEPMTEKIERIKVKYGIK